MPKVSKRCSSGQDKQNRDRPVHPYSRKALKISKQIVHDKKVESSKSATSVKLEHLAEKLRWFQDNLDDRHLYTKQDMIDLVTEYRNRFSDELDQIRLVQSVGNRQGQTRQHAARESSIKMTIEDETHQFEGSGIEVPDLINKKHLESFKKWDGEPKYIQNLKLRKISANDVKRLEVSAGVVSNEELEEINEAS
ncbi:translation machinery-associated protein 16 [Aplysia californica]|uniref:Translation machinery-associated protein 16 n=1 Tax=Aplysia californica TaxID=6500 RepID=A0ABM0JG86_APLCA|nr:translation machinery-associated protein 16 [Aplysia californica]